MKITFTKNPAAWAGVIQAIISLVAVYKPIPVEAILAIIAAATGISFHAQRIENQKTEAALWTDPEEID